MTFMRMVALTQIVSCILEQFFTLKAIRREDNLSQVLEKAKPIQMQLKHWYASLPSSLSIDDTKPRRLSSVGYLHLAYFTAEITIHRAILRSHASSGPRTELFFITRQAASSRFTYALDFVKRLKQEHFQSFWYFSSSRCLAIIGIFAGVLAVTSLDDAERKVYTDLLAEYRWILRISSNGSSVTKYGVKVLDPNSQFLEQAVSTPDSRSGSIGLFSPGHSIVSPTNEGWLDQSAFNFGDLGYMPGDQSSAVYTADQFFTF